MHIQNIKYVIWIKINKILNIVDSKKIETSSYIMYPLLLCCNKLQHKKILWK